MVQFAGTVSETTSVARSKESDRVQQYSGIKYELRRIEYGRRTCSTLRSSDNTETQA